MLSVWQHRGWTERGAALRYERLAQAALAGPFRDFAPALERARDDELTHAALCDALGGPPADAAPVDEANVPPGLAGDDAFLFEVVITCCVGETLNVVLLQDELGRAAEPTRATLRRLLADEITHSRLGWTVLDAARAQGRALATLAPGLRDALAAMEVAEDAGPERHRLLREGIADLVLPGLALHGLVLA